MNFGGSRSTAGYTRRINGQKSEIQEDGNVPLLSGRDDDDSEEELFERMKSGKHAKKQDKISKVKGELEGAINVMRNNLTKVLDRGDKLEDLEAKSENFEMSAFQFKATSTKLKNRMWWQNFKMKMIFGGVVVVILIVIIAFVSNGGYLVAEGDNDKCQGAGAYMIMIGFATMIFECACCLCPAKDNCCERFEKRTPYWVKGLVYFLSVIPILSLCFGVKTLISSVIMIILGLIYMFLTCLVKSTKYQRLQGEARIRYQEQRAQAQYTYNAFSTVSNTISSAKQAAVTQQNKVRPHRPKKGKPRTSTAERPKFQMKSKPTPQTNV